MKYKCNDCGAVFDEEDIAHWKESRGEFWGMPCYEVMTGCPMCHSGDLEEINEDDDSGEGDEDDG